MATSAALSTSNLFMQSFWNIFNLINTRSNVVDPLDASGLKRKFVYSREPDVGGRGFAGYPYVLVHPATLAKGESKSGDGKKANIDADILVEVRTSETFNEEGTFSDPNGSNFTMLDTISDDVIQTLNSASNRNTLRANKIGFVDIEDRGQDFIDLKGERIYIRELGVTFLTPVHTVSS